MWKTRICELLGIEYPILQGGMTMSGNPELAAAVSNSGALGMLGANSGYVPVDQREQNLRNCIRKARSLTDKPFGVNITIFEMEALAGRLIEAALEEGVKVFACSGGSPSLFTREIKDGGATAIHVGGNVKQAKKAEAAGVDIVVAEGYEAGGVNSPDELTTFVLVPYVADAVKIPVVAAGGIADARGFVAALALGAEGVQMGSCFVATEECHVHKNYKEAILAAKDTDTIVTRRVLGLRMRSLKNEFTNRLAEMDQRGAAEEVKIFVGTGGTRRGQLLGDTVNGDMGIGQVAGMIRKIIPAAEVLRRIFGDADTVLKRCLEIERQ